MSRPTSRTWAYVLGILRTEYADGTMTLETTDLQRLRKALGDEVLCGLLRLFEWADRVSGLIQFAYWNDQNLPNESQSNVRCGRLLALLRLDEGSAAPDAASRAAFLEL